MQISDQKILEGIVIGFEFELFSSKNRKDLAKEIGALIKKKIRVGYTYHSRGPAGVINDWHLEKDWTGGHEMSELVSPPMGYVEGMAILFKILSYMRQNCWTDSRCAFQFNISFDKFKLTDMKDRIEGINRLKFVLGFDEEFVYERFPKRKSSIYARSINVIYPLNKFMSSDNIDVVHKENFELPSEKYYGINFSKLQNGYLEIRYLGGAGYEKKSYEIKEIIDYTGKFIYNVLQNNYFYTHSEMAKLKTAMKEYKKVVSSFSDLESFIVNYPNIRLMVDLKNDIQVLKTFYPQVREKLFDLIMRCGVRRGMINYDSDLSVFQIKDAVIQRAFPLKNMEVFDSKILSGNILNCDLYRCEINNSHILDCNLYSGNKVLKSKIINSPVHVYNYITDSYLDNKINIINGTVEGGIIRSGDIGPTAKISKETEIIGKSADGKDSKDFPKDQGYGKDKNLPVTKQAFAPDTKDFKL